ncbi:MAG: hypothetical protein DHS20C05_23000 [Hyphococcus sp.]|nr:MAG: hypothetical protein DHS20C05_23000 [Marinicaulis sp.]
MLVKSSAIAALLFVGACASTGDQASAARPYYDHASAYGLPEGVDARVRAVFAAMGEQAPQNVSFSVTQIQRAEIGSRGLPATQAHEEEFAAPGKKEIKNFALDGATPTFINAQGAAENGGWVREEDAYRHIYSGMTCDLSIMLILPIDETNFQFASVPLSGIQLYNEQGNDTSCNYTSQTLGARITFYASQWPNVTLDDHFSGALNDMTKAMPIKEAAPVVVANADTDEEGYGPSSIEGETKAAAFFLEPVDGNNFKTILWLNKTGDWHVKARVTYLMPEQETSELAMFFSIEGFASTEYASKLEDVDKHINSSVLTQVSY